MTSIPSLQSILKTDSVPASRKSLLLPTEKKYWSEEELKEVDEYLQAKYKENEICLNPTISYLDEIFPLLNEAMFNMLCKIKEEFSFYHRKSTLHGLDFLSEYLYNMNPKYLERKRNWTYIFDMEWVVNFLKENPRPYYPFSLIWSREFASLKIQSYMRGYWTRIRKDVQELRQFWKDIREETQKRDVYERD